MPKICKTARYNRFNNPTYQRNEYEGFTFAKSLKSYDSGEGLYFTNFVKSENNQCYQWLVEYIKSASIENYYFLEDNFLPLDEIKYSEPNAKRLLEIMNKGYKYRFKPADLKNIFELKHKEKSKFHFFVLNDNNKLKVILIDFFHLGMNADLIVNGHRKKMKLEDIYRKEKENKWDLIELTKL